MLFVKRQYFTNMSTLQRWILYSQVPGTTLTTVYNAKITQLKLFFSQHFREESTKKEIWKSFKINYSPLIEWCKMILGSPIQWVDYILVDQTCLFELKHSSCWTYSQENIKFQPLVTLCPLEQLSFEQTFDNSEQNKHFLWTNILMFGWKIINYL